MLKCNMNEKTGIHYGVISFNSVMPEAYDDIYVNGENVTMNDALADHMVNIDEDDENYDNIVQEFYDNWYADDDQYSYKQDGYHLETTSFGIYVIESPFYTYARQCSPCCPNAGDLDSPDEQGFKTYCLGPDWFEDEKAPYKIFKRIEKR